MPNHATFQVVTEEFDPERIERGADSRDLVEDIDTIAVVMDHPLDAGDLAGNAAGALRKLDFLRWLHL